MDKKNGKTDLPCFVDPKTQDRSKLVLDLCPGSVSITDPTEAASETLFDLTFPLLSHPIFLSSLPLTKKKAFERDTDQY